MEQLDRVRSVEENTERRVSDEGVSVVGGKGSSPSTREGGERRELGLFLGEKGRV